MKKYLLLGISNPGERVETLVKLEIEEHDHAEAIEKINDAVTLVYDGVDGEGTDYEPDDSNEERA